MDLNQLSTKLAVRLDEFGFGIGIPIMLLSLLLLVQGYRRLQIVTLIVGGGIGFVLSPDIIPLLNEFGLALEPLQMTAAICLGCGLILSASVLASARLLTSAFIFISFTTGLETLNNYGFDIERSELWSGVAALLALFFTMGINKMLPSIFSAVFAAYGLLLGGLLITGNSVSTFEPVEIKTFILMLPIVVLSLLLQNHDKAKQQELELTKDEPDAKTKQAQQHFLKL
tara:strand:+ start:1380 stop:2063 length:684 start_codon:yes stop_codon:yes gene_type:complete